MENLEKSVAYCTKFKIIDGAGHDLSFGGDWSVSTKIMLDFFSEK